MTPMIIRPSSRVTLVMCAMLLLGLMAPRAFAQAVSGTIHVTVVDPSSAVIIGATVTVTGAEAATSTAVLPPVQTADTGIATVSGLTPGRYTVQSAFPGFETRILKDVRVR